MSLQFLRTCLSTGLLLSSLEAHAQPGMVTSTDFQEIFLTAGYATLFGAATGTALLPFLGNGTSQSLRIVAGGASLGFLAGSTVAFLNLGMRETAFEPPENDETYGLRYEDDTSPVHPAASAPTNGCVSGPSLVRGCGKNLGLGVPLFAAGPSGWQLSLLSWRF